MNRESPAKLTLPTVIEKRPTEPHQWTLSLFIPAELEYFKGHFPEAPILPGVVQVHWAEHFGRELLPLKGLFLRLEAVKFQQIIRPQQTVQLELEYTTSKNKLMFRFSSDKGQHATGRIVFGERN